MPQKFAFLLAFLIGCIAPSTVNAQEHRIHPKNPYDYGLGIPLLGMGAGLGVSTLSIAIGGESKALKIFGGVATLLPAAGIVGGIYFIARPASGCLLDAKGYATSCGASTSEDFVPEGYLPKERNDRITGGVLMGFGGLFLTLGVLGAVLPKNTPTFMKSASVGAALIGLSMMGLGLWYIVRQLLRHLELISR
jgi:hypothetical protein